MSNPNPQNQFKPGNNANPNGRPKKEWTWASLVREALEKTNLDGEPVKKGIAEALAAKALEGDVQAIKEIGNRIDGMPKQEVNSTVKVVEVKGLDDLE